MINRGLDDDLISFLRKALDSESDSLYDSRDIADPFPLYFPVMFVVYPIDDTLVILVGAECIAEYLVLTTFLQGLYNKVRCAEIHIRHP